jgi:hypothetical protein
MSRAAPSDNPLRQGRIDPERLTGYLRQIHESALRADGTIQDHRIEHLLHRVQILEELLSAMVLRAGRIDDSNPEEPRAGVPTELLEEAVMEVLLRLADPEMPREAANTDRRIRNAGE